MTFDLSEWLNLGLRWLHLIAGICWIGSSFYFVWLDNHLKPPKEGTASGEVWSVHGGGFYHKQKYQVAPETMPDDLHWFKWEAYFTWLSGFSLLVLIYYVGARSYLIDPAKAQLSTPEAIAIGLASLVAGWLFYNELCRSKLRDNEKLLGAVWLAFLVVAAWVLESVFTSRGAYLHVGAIIGTVMVANVFFVIIPNQRRVVAALVAGRQPDPALGKAAKQRSVHNNYFTLPVLFIMISHHYPMTYGADRPWLVLALLCLSGVAIRHVFNLRHRGAPTGKAVALGVALVIASVTYVSVEKGSGASTVAAGAGAGESSVEMGAQSTTGWASVQPVIQRHCISCHAAAPTDPAFSAPPLGVVLDSYEHAVAMAPRIKKVVVDSDIMPLGNVTGMTQAERNAIGAWIAEGTPQ